LEANGVAIDHMVHDCSPFDMRLTLQLLGWGERRIPCDKSGAGQDHDAARQNQKLSSFYSAEALGFG